jgi:3-deoxy-D-manno-octulosonic-acid transferase
LRPDLRLLLTHGTATGRDTGLALLRPGDAQRWLPFDLPGATTRFLRRHRPAIGVLMETEVWPQLQAAAQRAGVPTVLANARLSARSLRQSLRFDALLRPAAASLTRVLAQTEADAQRLRLAGAGQGPASSDGAGFTAGASAGTGTGTGTTTGSGSGTGTGTGAAASEFAAGAVVRVVGNLKFDLRPDPALLAQGRRWRAVLPADRPVLLAASWREGEDEPLLAAWHDLLRLHAQAQTSRLAPLLVLVPRHPQRFDAVASQVEAAGFSLSRRSRWAVQGDGAEPPDEAAQVDVWLGDSMREMPAWYALADAALLGGSFARLGGQNLIEAAACGCIVLMGPHTFNFAAAAELAIDAGAALRAADLTQALVQARDLFAQPDTLAQRRAAALAFATAHQGAARRMAVEILACLPGG